MDGCFFCFLSGKMKWKKDGRKAHLVSLSITFPSLLHLSLLPCLIASFLPSHLPPYLSPFLYLLHILPSSFTPFYPFLPHHLFLWFKLSPSSCYLASFFPLILASFNAPLTPCSVLRLPSFPPSCLAILAFFLTFTFHFLFLRSFVSLHPVLNPPSLLSLLPCLYPPPLPRSNPISCFLLPSFLPF